MRLFPRQTVAARRVLPTIGGSLILVMFLSLVLLAHTKQASASASFAVYLEPATTPTALRINIDPGLLRANGITVVQQVDRLQAVVSATQPKSIWINDAALPTVSQAWLRQQMRSGVVIVGINVTRRSLANALGTSADGSLNRGVSTPARLPMPPDRSVIDDPVWDWRHPSKPTFVIYYEADVPIVNSAGQRTVVHNYGSFNEAFEPQKPAALFFVIREAIQQASQGTGR